MTIADVVTRDRNGIFECGGAWVRAHRRQLATVVTIRGEIDACNTDRVGEHLRRFVLGEDRVVLDMSGVSEFATAGISLLETFDDACRAEGAQWTLVASPAVAAVAADGGFSDNYSVPEALHDLADAIASRRRMALPLVRMS
ncbi:STAS domain-containing protein [Mycobacterium paraffinicum]|uniref:STAS domain-containing protein n=1 Tax=Mycobacterium paraffinicum TaxID=53378 RepID=A0A1Q4I2T2_9MYCO|nr:STAS domain-containing protein [Mycobacterium paraffinicum]OJZ76294.1 STAS domain-containing protein [Mycobacterium paraffinicum]